MAYRILDTFPEFQAYWSRFETKSTAEQIDGWREEYMAAWPELLTKQIDDYETEGFDWIEIAKGRIFPEMSPRMPEMVRAYSNLETILGQTIESALEALGFRGDLIAVIYVGIGLGAGWATVYNDKPAVLFGLENIADCGWTGKEALRGLIAHEIGHLTHFQVREEVGVPRGAGAWWQLYSEGVAMRCEHKVIGRESWHMRQREGGDDWLGWCRSNQAWLAAEFIRKAESGASVRPFFGSWYDLNGYRQTGYFLGHELILMLEQELSFHEICLLDAEGSRMWKALSTLAEGAVT